MRAARLVWGSCARGVVCAAVMASALVASGCGISEEKHRSALRDLEDVQIKLAQARKVRADHEAAAKAATARAVKAEAKAKGAQAMLKQRTTERDRLQKEQDRLRGELSLYQTKSGGLEKALQATKAEVALLKAARARAERREREHRALQAKLDAMIRAGTLSVKLRRGKMVIQLADSVLFSPGKAALKPDGEKALEQVAGVLRTIRGQEFLVAGHTDDQPIKSGRFASNWALSTARAVHVVAFLQKKGVPPQQLGAAGYAAVDPVAPNDTAKGRAKNRRIEIILMPDLEELAGTTATADAGSKP